MIEQEKGAKQPGVINKMLMIQEIHHFGLWSRVKGVLSLQSTHSIVFFSSLVRLCCINP